MIDLDKYREVREDESEEVSDANPIASDATRELRLFRIKSLIVSGRSKRANEEMEIPPRYFGKSLDNFGGHKTEVDVARCTIHAGQSVFLSGECGTGKTHLAVALMNWWYANRYTGRSLRGSALFLSAVEFFIALKNTFGDSGTSEDSVLSRYSSTPFLLIDDLGAEKISDWSRQQFFTLIDRRYRNKLQTIITSNLDLTQVCEMIDDRISSRILEMGTVLRLNGDDKRLLASGTSTWPIIQ